MPLPGLWKGRKRSWIKGVRLPRPRPIWRRFVLNAWDNDDSTRTLDLHPDYNTTARDVAFDAGVASAQALHDTASGLLDTHAGFDADGQMFVNTRFGDFPHYAPTAQWSDRNALLTPSALAWSRRSPAASTRPMDQSR